MKSATDGRVPVDVADDELERLARLADVGLLAAELVHEVRQPLLGVKAFAQMIEENAKDPAFCAARAADIVRQARAIEVILERVRGYLRGSSPTAPVVAFAHEAVALAIAVLGRSVKRPGLALELDVPPDLPPIAVEGTALQQIFVNLLANARDALAGREGRVRVSARATSDGKVEIVVEDDGPGVPAEARGSLFEPFRTTKPEGTGLGLYVSRRLARAAKGELVHEQPERGARFRVRLPVRADYR